MNGLLESEDVLHTIAAMREFGVIVKKLDEQQWSIYGRGVGGFDEPKNALYLGNSGTGVRLLLGLAAGNPINAFFIGDNSLSKRPMRRVTAPLEILSLIHISEPTRPY